jgi:hypothetical protein
MTSVYEVESLKKVWERAGCIIVKLPDGSGVVIAPKKGVMLELNRDGYLLVEKLSSTGFDSGGESIFIQYPSFMRRLLDVLQ